MRRRRVLSLNGQTGTKLTFSVKLNGMRYTRFFSKLYSIYIYFSDNIKIDLCFTKIYLLLKLYLAINYNTLKCCFKKTCR